MRRSSSPLGDTDVDILSSALEDALTLEEICYSTGLKLSVCIARIKRLMDAGLLDRFHPHSEEGKSRGGVFVYQLPQDVALELGANRRGRL